MTDEPETIPDRDEQGRIREQYSDDEILRAIRKHAPATTGDIAEEVGMSRRNAGYRLDRLEEEGRVKSKSVGPNRVWMPPE